MKILDFLYYCNAKYLNKFNEIESKKAYGGTWASFTITLTLLIWVASIIKLIEYFTHNIHHLTLPGLYFYSIVFVLIFVLRYFYVTKGRLKLIMENKIPVYKVIPVRTNG